eukprot:symbB.v1.2.015224.t1/scaffold1115.1/size137032/9
MQYLDGGHWDVEPQKCVFGEVYQKVMSSLKEVGYTVQSRQINSDGWLPQKRERLYFVGFRKDVACNNFKWPEAPTRNTCLKDILDSDVEELRRCQLSVAQWTAVQKSATWQSGGDLLRLAQLEGHARTLTSSYKASFACTAELVSTNEDREHGLERPRFFTRRECARMMGFPETYVFANQHSENRAYHQLGNAVCPPVIKAIAEREIVDWLQLHEATERCVVLDDLDLSISIGSCCVKIDGQEGLSDGDVEAAVQKLNSTAGDVSSVLQHFSEAASTVPAWRQRWERLERKSAKKKKHKKEKNQG